MTPVKTTAIDEEGYFVLQDGIRLNEEDVGREMLSQIQIDDFGVLHLHYENNDILVEAFDKPFVAKQVHLENDKLVAQMPYQFRATLTWESLCLDEWDRFHAKTNQGIPVVFSRPAQNELFNLADGFDDDSLHFGDRKVETPSYYQVQNEVNKEEFWTHKYNENPSPPWNLDKVHPELPGLLTQLKLNKCRVLIPGCGYGHDAAFFAERGHIVTAVDISPNAIAEAKKLYGHLDNINFVEADVFEFIEDNQSSFDLIFEHTFYCAISPDSREKCIKHWKRALTETGHLLGIFFVVPKRTGPYFGGSEWELRDKLSSRFNFFYWTRLKKSPGWRKGSELCVYAQVKP